MKLCDNWNFAKSGITYRSSLSKLIYILHKNASAHPDFIGKNVYAAQIITSI